MAATDESIDIALEADNKNNSDTNNGDELNDMGDESIENISSNNIVNNKNFVDGEIAQKVIFLIISLKIIFRS